MGKFKIASEENKISETRETAICQARGTLSGGEESKIRFLT